MLSMLNPILLPYLLAPILSPAPTASLADGLSRAIPADFGLVVLLDDLDNILQGEERGDLARFLTDPRWLSLADYYIDDTFRSEYLGHWLTEDEAPFAEQVWACVRSVKAGALGKSDFTDEDGNLLVVLATDGGLLGRLQVLFENSPDPLRSVELEGLDVGEGVGPMLVEDARKSTLAFERDGIFVLSYGDPGWIEEALLATLASVSGANESDHEDLWWLATEDRLAGAQLECFVQLDEADQADFSEGLGLPVESVGPLYLALAAGEGRNAEGRVRFEMEAPELLGELADCALEPDLGLLQLAGADDLGAYVAAFDWISLLDFGLGLAGEAESFDEGLAAVDEMLGMSVMDDLLGNLTGQLLVVYTRSSAIAAFSEGDEPLDGFLPIFAFQLDDSEPFLDLIESVLPMMDLFDLEEAHQEISGADAWLVPGEAFEMDEVTELGLALTEDFLIFGGGQGVRDLIGRLAGESGEEPYGLAVADEVAAELTGCVVSLSSTAAVMALLPEIIDGMAADAFEGLEGNPDPEFTIEAIELVIEIATDHLSGFSLGEWVLDRNAITLRTLSR